MGNINGKGGNNPHFSGFDKMMTKRMNNNDNVYNNTLSKYLNITDVEKTIKIFYQPEDIVEIRQFIADESKIHHRKNNFFKGSEIDKILNHLKKYSEKSYMKGFYFVPQKIKKDLTPRGKINPGIGDIDIAAYNWLLIDLDPEREPKNQPSSDEEKTLAYNLMQEIADYMEDFGFTKPIIGDSANGYHLVYKIEEMENKKDNVSIIERCLKFLNKKFSNEKVKVDTTVYNPSRIWKLYGTISRKGNEKPEENRFFRLSKLLEVPEPIEDTPFEIVKKLSEEYSENTATVINTQNIHVSNVDVCEFDLKKWIEVNEIDKKFTLKEKTEKNFKYFYEFANTCPISPDKHNDGAFIAQRNDGALILECHHDTCNKPENFDASTYADYGSGKLNHWKGFRAKYEKINILKPTIKTVDNTNVKVKMKNADNGKMPELNLPDDNFIKQYIKYGDARSAAYPEYHLTSALALLSVIGDRRCYFDFTQERIYTNIWALNLGTSTISRKSTALRTFERLYDDVLGDIAQKLPKTFSTEALYEILSEKTGENGEIIQNSHRLWYLDECGNAFKKMGYRGYNADMPDVLSNLYDNPPSYVRELRTKHKEQSVFTINNPYLTLLMATTPDNMYGVDEQIIKSGLIYRFLIVHPKYFKQFRTFTPVTPQIIKMEIDLKNRLNEIKNKIGNREIEFLLDEGGMDYFGAWHEKIENEIHQNKNEIDSVTRGRMVVYAYKIAILSYIADKSFLFSEITGDGKITLHVPIGFIKFGCKIIEEYFLPSSVEFIRELYESKSKNYQIQIKRLIKANGGEIPHRELRRGIRMGDKIFIQTINSMIEETEEIVATDNETKGNKGIIYRWIGG